MGAALELLMRRRIVLLMASIALIQFAPLASSQPSTFEGAWVSNGEGCWEISLTNSNTSILRPIPESGVYLYPVDQQIITFEGYLSSDIDEGAGTSGVSYQFHINQNIEQVNASCSTDIIIISSVINQSEPEKNISSDLGDEIGQEGINGAISLFSAFLYAMVLTVAILVLVLATDEKTQYSLYKSTNIGQGKMNKRSQDAVFLQGRILGFLSSNEGLHFSAIAEAFSLGNHQTAYHLSILEKSQHLWSKRDGRKLRFFTSAIRSNSSDGLPQPVDLPSVESIPARIMADIESIERGNLRGVRQTDIAARIGVTQQLVSHHIRSLERLDWLMRKGRGRKVTMHLTIAGLDVLGRIRCDDETPNYQKQPPMDLQVE